ncbi:MAG: hypothetical protein AAF530_03275 [Pseudomonadota bacterium]
MIRYLFTKTDWKTDGKFGRRVASPGNIDPKLLHLMVARYV